MNIAQSIILALVQSIAEWLPVSSSAHLAIVDRIMQSEAGIFYFVLLHFATLISLLIYLKKDAWTYFIKNKKLTTKGRYVILASIPIFAVGYFLNEIVESLFTDMKMIGVALIINSFILFSTRFFNNNSEITFQKAMAIGVMQIFALVPGISRSGITISTGLFSGIKKEEVIYFAMLLSLPAIGGATAYMMLNTPIETLTSISFNMITGFLVAVVAGYFSLALLVKKVKQGRFSNFWSYCFIIGLIMLFN